MKTQNLHLILTAILTILSASALAKVEPHLPEDPTGILIGRAHPELADIKGLYLDIAMPEGEAKKYGLALKELKSKIEIKLGMRGITLTPQLYNAREITSPVLRVDIDVLRLDDSQQHVFRAQTSLARSVHLATQPKLGFQADVWKAKAAMQAVSVQNMPATVTAAVLAQVDSFIADYRIANPPGKRPTDANDFAALVTAPTRQTKPPVKPTTTEHGFVASKNSKVFHKPDCSSAKRIKPGNLVTYGTRDKATQAGKRPCKICKP
ncbi:MAG: Ada metal-binding domain-containing protein [Sedimentisphaerales bacterium]